MISASVIVKTLSQLEFIVGIARNIYPPCSSVDSSDVEFNDP